MISRRQLLGAGLTVPGVILANSRPSEAEFVSVQSGLATTVAGMNFVYKQVGPADSPGATIIELVVAPGAGAPPHHHQKFDEAFFILEGVFEVTVGDETHQVGPGGLVSIPGGVTHSFTNRSQHLARTLTISSPHGLEDYFQAAGRSWDRPYQEVPAKTLEDVQRLVRLGPSYGVTILLPKP